MKVFTLVLLFLVAFSSFSQKKIVDYTAYADWKVIKDYQLSTDGNFFAFTANPYEGNSTAYLLNVQSSVDTLLTIKRGSDVAFDIKNTFFLSKISGDYNTIRNLKIKDTKTYKLPKDTLLIKDLSSLNTKEIYLSNVEKYAVVDSSSLIIGVFAHNFKLKNNHLSKRHNKQFKDGYEGKEKTFFIANAVDGVIFQATNAVDYYLEEEQQFVFITEKHTKKGKDFYTVTKINLTTFDTQNLEQRFEKIESSYASSKKNTAFLIGKLFDVKQKRNELYRVNNDFSAVNALNINQLMDSNFAISPTSSIELLADSDILLFDLQRNEPEKKKDTLLKEEQVKLDIWTWDEPNIKPKQLLEAKKYYSKKFLASYDLTHKKIDPIEDDTLSLNKRWKKSPYALITSSFQYDIATSYEYPWREDVYLIDLRSGEKTVLLNRNFSNTVLTPNADYFYYEKEADTNYYVRNLATQQEECLTCAIQERWKEDLNGMDYIPSMTGRIDVDEDKISVWFNSTKALYRYNPQNNELRQITPKEWLNRKIELNYYKIVSDSQYFNPENIIIEVFDLETKFNAYYAIDKDYKITEILNGYYNAFSFLKDEKHNRYFARIQTNEIYPNFNEIKAGNHHPITDVNPQQKEYNWSTVELVKWTAYDGQELEGLLYKPENYDSTKKYPLIVYYYETSSEDIHRYSAPRPTASIIFSTEYASSGYFVFMPDIRYTIGHPGKGAYNSIMSGTDYVLSCYPSIDSTRMGLQGQSWGGYQTAQLITMTNRYTAAMAGAPVSNMFSAYGGIRWGSGLSRQFQYEHTQSRIGKTIWEAPELYVENSPVFGLPNVTTPLLIMHNDNDGAVPWYQGVEIFMGLRRLGKPAWLLNYNGDEHNLMKKGNRKDLSLKMKQFFDFYLNGGDEPEWMEKGEVEYK